MNVFGYGLVVIVAIPICYIFSKNYVDKKCANLSNYFMMKGLQMVTGVAKENKPNFQLNKFGKTATIQYARLGNNYNLTIPYNRKSGIKDRKYRVFIRYPNEMELIEITQQPGVKYFVSGSMLGADKVVIENIETMEQTDYDVDSIIKTY